MTLADQSTRHPAWRGMGLWKWIAGALVAYCLGILPFYVLQADGGNGLGAHAEIMTFGECAFAYSARLHEGTLSMRARLTPVCAEASAPPVLQFADGDGVALAETILRGGPNALSGMLELPEAVASNGFVARVTFTDQSGVAHLVEIAGAAAPRTPTSQSAVQ